MTNHEENKMANIQGAYHPDLACLQETESGILLMFRDATYHTDEDSTIVERDMTVGKRRFHVTSVFSNRPTSTATKKCWLISTQTWMLRCTVITIRTQIASFLVGVFKQRFSTHSG